MVLLALLAIIILLVLGVSVVGLAIKLLWWALIGLFIGGLARLVIPGHQPIGTLATALGGIAGALLGGVIADAAALGGFLQFILAIAIAAVIVVFYSRSVESRAP
jgi:uncharacterized membrane protein YeaQ/YmgE (transglycosylase-associated protein family)